MSKKAEFTVSEVIKEKDQRIKCEWYKKFKWVGMKA